MRLTLSLRHVQRYHWGKGWGPKPGRDVSNYMFRIQWKAKSKRKIFECFQTLPPDVTTEDPNQFVKRSLIKEFCTDPDSIDEKKEFPWPHSHRPIKGLSDDPRYQTRTALVFDRHRKLLDPLYQSLFFTNTVLEGLQQMPETINHLMSDLKIDQNFNDLIQRRLEWCLSSDSILRKLPLDREFPYLDQRPPRVWGIPTVRKELNYLTTFYDLSQTLSSKLFGFIESQKISYPYCVLPFERNNKLVVFDLETDFITVGKTTNNLPLFSTTPLITIDKPLTPIEPLSWTTCFFEKNIYPIDYTFKLPVHHSIHTIYFTHRLLRRVDDIELVGRAINYCYGYTCASARNLYGDDIGEVELPDPIPVQCVFTNPMDFSLGFVCFQLNTTSFESSLKNQVWFRTGIKDINEVMKHLIAFQTNGFVDSITKELKTCIKTN